MFVGWNIRCCDTLEGVLGVLCPERDNCGIAEGVCHIIDPNGRNAEVESSENHNIDFAICTDVSKHGIISAKDKENLLL